MYRLTIPFFLKKIIIFGIPEFEIKTAKWSFVDDKFQKTSNKAEAIGIIIYDTPTKVAEAYEKTNIKNWQKI